MPEYDLNQFTPEELKEYLDSGVIPDRFVHRSGSSKHSNSDIPPVIQAIPRETWWAGGAMGVVLIVFTWPLLLLGAILGMVGAGFLLCPNRKKK